MTNNVLLYSLPERSLLSKSSDSTPLSEISNSNVAKTMPKKKKSSSSSSSLHFVSEVDDER